VAKGLIHSSHKFICMRTLINPLIIFLALFMPLMAASAQSNYLDHVYDYIENTSVFELSQEPGHVPLVPYNTTQEALAGMMEKSGSYLSLNGTWKFFFSQTPEGTPSGFYNLDFNDSKWSSIIVPGNWEMQGFGDPLFRNVTTPFKPTPPRVPHEYNPTGSYRKTFELPSDWKGKQVFLRLEKAASASFIWINGKEAGYNEGGQEPAEYNITRYLKPGKNTLAVNVYKYSDGYYLEDQDYWRLAGIFGDVWLFATPTVHISDWYATTDFDDHYRDAVLALAIDVKNYGDTQKGNYKVRAVLYNKNQAVDTLFSGPFEISPGLKQTINLSEKIKMPLPWSAEFPNLYTLVFELADANGKIRETLSGRIGFKETEIRKQVFYLNGKPVKLNAINSHMQHPDLGHTMNEETIRKDFTLLKQFNINCVRTSHYPPVIRYLELADEYGIYIVDETGDESHATEFVSGLPEWRDMYVERVQKMVLRDRNHPCILFWSAGNESGEGKNICAVIEEGKKLDHTRYWMYGGNAFAHPCEDIIGPRYYTPFEMVTLVGMVPDSIDPRPSFMDEYLSVAGNGGGGLDDYWEMIRNYPRSMGGAIWDFVSPGLREKVISLEDVSPNHVQVNVMGRAKLVSGKSGMGIDLNGHDQWVEVYRDKAVEISGNQLTLSMWIYPRSLNSSSGTLINKGSFQYGIRQIGEDSVEFYITTARKYAVKSPLPDNWKNNWHQVVAVYDGSKMSLFIDGKPGAELPASGNIKNLPFPVNIGRNAEIHGQETSVYLCDGVIDMVGIFDRALKPDQLATPSDELKRKSSLWLDFEESKQEGEFFTLGIGARSYGAIWPDRRPQPEMWQIKKSGQPVSAKLTDASEGLVEISNHYLFTNLRDLQTVWMLMADGDTVDKGELITDIGPGDRAVMKIPFQKTEGKTVNDWRLILSFRQKENKIWAAAGFEIAFEQFEIPGSKTLQGKVQIHSSINLVETGDSILVKGDNFVYTFDRKEGILISMRCSGKELIREGPRLNVWRPPLANETDQWGSSSSGTTHWGEGFGHFAATDWYTTGLDNLHRMLESFSYRKTKEVVEIEIRDIQTMSGKSDGFQDRYMYTINGEGELTIRHTVIPAGDMPAWLPRVGTQWILGKSLDQVQWYGRGPQENYPDRKSGYKIGKYASSVEDMIEPYLIPQDYGLRTDNTWVRMLDLDGNGIEFSGEQLFNFSAWPYSVENLTKALYTYQRKPFDGITFNFDYATSGVGCTARSVFNQYRVMPQRYEFLMRVKPVEKLIK
jgi:beta-galactosidase